MGGSKGDRKVRVMTGGYNLLAADNKKHSCGRDYNLELRDTRD